MSQQIDSAPVLTSTCYANRKWMLREHHGWRALVKKFSTRAEFDDAIADAIADAAGVIEQIEHQLQLIANE